MYPTQKWDAKTAITSLRNDVETTGGFDGLSYVPSQCCEKKNSKNPKSPFNMVPEVLTHSNS